MADEITGIGVMLPNGRERATMLYYWDMASPVLDGDSVAVVPISSLLTWR